MRIGWEDVSKPVLARYSVEAQPSIARRGCRADAAFALPALFDVLEAEGWDYAIRIEGNPKLYDRISWLMKRGPGRLPHRVVRRFTSFHYRAKSRSEPRRVVAKVAFHPGALFPTVGFIVTNRSLPNERVPAFYNDRGTAEQHIKEGKSPSSGRACHACASPPTPFVSSFTHLPTPWRPSCARWPCLRPLSVDRSPLCVSTRSRPARGWGAMHALPFSSVPMWHSLAPCSRASLA